MATAEHKHPNYMAIFWYLAILTVIEIAVIYMPLAKFTIGVLLCALALGKAVLVAMYFMHLRFEKRGLAIVAFTPVVILVWLVLMLMPDITTRLWAGIDAHEQVTSSAESAPPAEAPPAAPQ